MNFGLTIAGVSKLLKAGTFSLKEIANRRCTASFEIISEDRSYRPADNAEVIITEDGDRIFGGLINAPQERGLAGGHHPGILTTVTAVDFQVYLERRYFRGTLAAGTLKSQLTTLTTYLSGFGVTLDGAQVNGPAMPELTFDTYTRLDVVVQHLMTLTANSGQPFVAEIDYFKVFRAYQPSTELAPFDLVGDDLPEVIGDVEVDKTRSEGYATRLIVVSTPKEETDRQETFTGDGTDGPFQLTYTVRRHYGHLTLSTGGGETLETAPATEPATTQWEYDPVTNSLTRLAGNTVNGTDYTITMAEAVFSGSWTADSGAPAEDLVEKVITIDFVGTDESGQEFADAELAKRMQPIQTVKYTTWEQGLAIGQQQTITIPSRDVDGTAVIVEIESRDLVQRLERRVTAVIDDSQTNIGRTAYDDYEKWYGDKTTGGGVSISVGDGGVGSAGPGLPFNSVQFNNEGAFGGDAEFTYDPDTDSVVCGAEASITASFTDSCQVWGRNCHIANP